MNERTYTHIMTAVVLPLAGVMVVMATIAQVTDAFIQGVPS